MPDSKSEVECVICGREGEPYDDCNICHGQARTQSKAKTLSEIRSETSKGNSSRSGSTAGPKSVKRPGSQNN